MYRSSIATGQVAVPVLAISTESPWRYWSVLLEDMCTVIASGVNWTSQHLSLETSSYRRKAANASSELACQPEVGQ